MSLHLFKGNLYSVGYPLLIRGLSACTYFRQPRGEDALFLPEIFSSLIFKNSVEYIRKLIMDLRAR